MSLLIRRMHAEWPSWLAVSFIALLPFGRFAEIPLSMFALSLVVLWRDPARKAQVRASARFVLPLFLCYWVPMVLSALDSFDPTSAAHVPLPKRG